MPKLESMRLPSGLVAAIERAGYFPETALEAVRRALGTSRIRAFLVRPETTFEGPEVRRHLTVLLLGEAHMFVVHLDDEVADALNPPQVLVGTERVRLRQIHNLALAQVFDSDGARVASDQAEVTIGMSWGANRRIELERAWCDDPNCEADHGLTGSSQQSDLLVRVSALADGPAAVQEALEFFDAVNAVTE